MPAGLVLSTGGKPEPFQFEQALWIGFWEDVFFTVAFEDQNNRLNPIYRFVGAAYCLSFLPSA